MGYFYTEDELAHHGILGQKWGIRRFETEGGHLTALGKKRYDGNPVTEKEKKQFADAQNNLSKAKAEYRETVNKYGSSSKRADRDKVDRATGMYELRKRQAKDAKTQIQMDHRKKEAGKREQSLVEKYKKQGMSQQEAELKAYKQVKLEKALIAAGAVTVAAAAAYGAKKYHDYVTDEVIKAGSIKMKRITKDSTNDLHDTFYAAFGKKDANRYVGLYGKQVSDSGDVFQKTIDIKENLKIASDKNAKNIMAETFRKASKEEREEYIKDLDSWRVAAAQGFLGDKQAKTIKQGYADIRNGKYDTKAAYDALNIAMPGNHTKLLADFKQNLKDKGYAGIKDRNDNVYSGYNTKSARIIFDNSKVTVSDVKKLATADINKQYGKEVAKDSAKAVASGLAPSLSLYGGLGIASLAITGSAEKNASKQRDKTAIQKYKKDHPGTKLSNDEILENYYGGKK